MLRKRSLREQLARESRSEYFGTSMDQIQRIRPSVLTDSLGNATLPLARLKRTTEEIRSQAGNQKLGTVKQQVAVDFIDKPFKERLTRRFVSPPARPISQQQIKFSRQAHRCPQSLEVLSFNSRKLDDFNPTFGKEECEADADECASVNYNDQFNETASAEDPRQRWDYYSQGTFSESMDQKRAPSQTQQFNLSQMKYTYQQELSEKRWSNLACTQQRAKLCELLRSD